MKNRSHVIAAIKNYLQTIKDIQKLDMRILASELGYLVEEVTSGIEEIIAQYNGFDGKLDSDKKILTVEKNMLFCESDFNHYDREITTGYNCDFCGNTTCVWCLGTRLFMNQFICPKCYKKIKMEKINWKDETIGPQQDFTLSLDAFMEQRYNTARRLLERINDKNLPRSNRFGIALALACCYEKLNKQEKTWKWLERAKKVDAGSSMLLLAFGHFFEMKDEEERALDYYQKAISIEPDNPAVHSVLGNFYEFTGKSDEALTAYHKSIELDPINAVYWVTLGDFYDLAEEDELAEKAYIRATELEENNPEIWKILGFFYEVRDQVKDATRCYQMYYSLVPKDYASDKRVTGYFRTSNEIMDAKREYQQALSLDDPQKWNELARTYRNRENYDKAIHFYEKSLKKEPNQIKVLKEIATLYNVTHQIGKAEELFDKIEEMEGISETIATSKENQVSNLLRETLDFVVASRRYENTNGIGSQKMPWEEIQIVSTSGSEGEYSQLIAYLEKMLLFNPEDRDTLRKLAMIYKKSGNRGKYEECMMKLHSLTPLIDTDTD